jgi:hypothetical protein
MTNPQPVFIEGRVSRKTATNALRITFSDGPDSQLGEALQGGADGRGSKAAVLFGFKNGGVGKHRLSLTDGRELIVASREGEPTTISDAADAPVGSIERGDSSTAMDAVGRTVLTFTANPTEDKTPDLFRIDLHDAGGASLGELAVIRQNAGWKAKSFLDVVSAIETYEYWMGHAGQPLKIPLQGTRVVLSRQPSAIERDLLLAACVDITLGLRPYIAAMN